MVRILFFGDIVGRPGRSAVKAYLASLSRTEAPDIVIGNVENASHGFGLTEKNYTELKESGLDVMTSGNHIWDKREVVQFIGNVPDLLRPYNMSDKTAGSGYGIYESHNGYKIAVINAIGQVFMGSYDSPWNRLDNILEAVLAVTHIVFFDFHAEATAEKLALGHYLSENGVSAFTGTHTHVQTNDYRILNNKMGYITDTGFCGAYDSVIGMEKSSSIARLREPYPVRLDVADSSVVQINATHFDIDPVSGVCRNISTVNTIFDYAEMNTPVA